MPQSESPVPSPSIPDDPEAAVQDDLTALAPGSVASLFSAAMRPGDSVKSVKACQTIAPRCPPAALTVARNRFQRQARRPAPAARREV